MKEYILDNGLKLIYKKGNSELTSVAISLDAGASRDGECFGVAHATEHMIYKGTVTRSEKEINEELSSIFGFQNAMTNYPYVVFYGTLLSEDLDRALELLSDILLEPLLTEEGFNEEMRVIKQELNEWDEELDQYVEDKLYLNSMENRRLKYPIIGTEQSLNKMSLDDVIDFFNNYYCANNATITIVSNLEYDEVRDMVEEYFDYWRSENIAEKKNNLPVPISEVFVDKKENINNAKVQIIFPINELNHWEIKALKVFNQYFGEGVNSLLFDTLRTKHGLVYDVLTRVANEEHIKVYKIIYSISQENINKSLEIIDELIGYVNNNSEILQKHHLNSLIKGFKLKRLFADEQSVRLAKEIATYDTMFGDGKLYLDETEDLDKLTVDYVLKTAKKVLINKSVQIIK